jgi:hypothetical protein
MDWLYHIPHVWNSPQDRAIWEDVYLMPSLPLAKAEKRTSIWLTVDALGDENDDDPFAKEWFGEKKKKLGDRGFVIDKKICDMVVKAAHFNKEELLEWARVFIKEVFADPRPVLYEAPFEAFAGTNRHARTISGITDSLAGKMPEEAADDKDKTTH